MRPDEFVIRTCDCGKKFCTAPYYAWRIREKYYCSYTCMRKDEKKKLKPIDDEY